MIRIFLIAALLVSTASCYKRLLGCKDDELSLTKQNVPDTILRLDGYYYSAFDTGYSDVFFSRTA